MAQVNAWQNYELSTSKHARRITSNSNHGKGRLETRAYEDLELGTSGLQRSWHGMSNSYHGRVTPRENLNRSHHGLTSGLSNSIHTPRIFQAPVVQQADSKDGKTDTSAKTLELTPKQFTILHDLFFPFFGFKTNTNDENPSFSNEKISCSKLDLFKKFFSAVNATLPQSQELIMRLKNRRIPEVLFLPEFCCRGIAQVYFQNNPISGFFILIGLFVNNPMIAAHGLIGLIVGNLTAMALGFDKGLIYSGLFGYNSILVGLALATFQSSPTWDYKISIATIFFSAFSSIIFVCLGKLLGPYKTPPLTLPFNIATLMILMSRVVIGPLSGSPSVQADKLFTSFLIGTIRGVGQVFLASNLYASVIMLIGISICSRIAAIAALLGSGLGTAVALATNSSVAAAEFGLFGFNSSLSVVAMLMFYAPSGGAVFLALLNGIMTVSVQQALVTLFAPYGLPVMTLPFCLATLPFLLIQGTTSRVIAVPLASMTVPEDHMKRVKVLKEGFNIFEDAINHEESLDKASVWTKETKVMHIDQQDSVNARFLFHTLADPETKNKEFALSFETLTRALEAAGLNEDDSFQFLSDAWALCAYNESKSMNKDQFVQYAHLLHNLKALHETLREFFNFVDSEGNGFIDLGEFDAARECLGQSNLNETERDSIMNIVGINDPMSEFNSSDLISFVLLAKMKFEFSHQN